MKNWKNLFDLIWTCYHHLSILVHETWLRWNCHLFGPVNAATNSWFFRGWSQPMGLILIQPTYIYIYLYHYIYIYLYLYLYIYIFIHRKELACKDWRSNRRMIAFKAWAHRAPGVPHGQLLHGFLINPVRMCKQTLKIAVFFAYVHWKYPLVN